MKRSVCTAATVAALAGAASGANAVPVPLADLLGRDEGLVVGDKHFRFGTFMSGRFDAHDIMVDAVTSGPDTHGFRLITTFDDPAGDAAPSDGYLTFSVRTRRAGGHVVADRIRFGAATGESGSWVRLNEHVLNQGGDEILSRSFLAEGGQGDQVFEADFDHEGSVHEFLDIQQDMWIFSAPDGSAVAQFMERTFETVSVPLPSAGLLGGGGLLVLTVRRRRC